jgi:hemolysin III
VASRIREPFNALSHLMGAIFVLLATGYLVFLGRHNPVAWISFLVFGAAGIYLYTASSIYHWTKTAKNGLQKMDHTAIYVMIAGCYTPVCLIALSGPTGWAMLAVQWLLAITGVVLTIVLAKPPMWVRLVLYLVMGWMVLPFASQVAQRSSTAALVWMLAGGLAYTIGTIIYASRRPALWPGKFSSHELWHVFVMAGTLCHVMTMRGLVTA